MPVPMVATGANPYGPQIGFRTEDVLPPAAVYVGPDDALLLEARAPTVSAPVHLTLRRLTPDGEISSDQYDLNVSTSGVQVQEFIIPPAEGYILSAHCRSETPERGQLFVRLHARRNIGGTDQALGQLFFQGYVTTDDHLGYPQSPTESSLSGRGWLRVVSPANPPAGQAVFIGVPQGVRWALRGVTVQLNTSAATPVRYPLVDIVNAVGFAQLKFPAAQSQGPSMAASYVWAEGLAPITAGPGGVAPLSSDLLISAGWGIVITTLQLDAADQFLSASVYVEEYVAT